ncbi:MAG TPA: hypothetical protein VF679_13500 [Pedobacter sp.]
MEFGSYEGMAALSQMIATAVREGLRLDREERRIGDGENFNAKGRRMEVVNQLLVQGGILVQAGGAIVHKGGARA